MANKLKEAWQAGAQAGEKVTKIIQLYTEKQQSEQPGETPPEATDTPPIESPDFGERFVENLGAGAEAMFKPVGQMAQGAAQSLQQSGQEFVEGAQDVATMAQAPNPAARVGKAVGGIGKMAGSAMYAPAGAAIAGLTAPDQTKPIGQALGAVPQFLGEQAEGLYGTPDQQGAFGQAAEQLQIPGGKEAADFMQYGGGNVAKQAANVLYAKALSAGIKAIASSVQKLSNKATPEQIAEVKKQAAMGNRMIKMDNTLQDLKTQYETNPTPALADKISALENQVVEMSNKHFPDLKPKVVGKTTTVVKKPKVKKVKAEKPGTKAVKGLSTKWKPIGGETVMVNPKNAGVKGAAAESFVAQITKEGKDGQYDILLQNGEHLIDVPIEVIEPTLGGVLEINFDGPRADMKTDWLYYMTDYS